MSGTVEGSTTGCTISDGTLTWSNQEVDCSFKDKCSSHPNKCNSCRRNMTKKDYYVPEDYYIPIPYYPTYEWPYVWYENDPNYIQF